MSHVHSSSLRRLAVGTAVFALAQASALAQTGTTPSPAPNKSAESSTKADSTLAGADRKFVMEAAKGGLTEVTLGQLAQQKGGSDAVKQFGSRMATDHAKANDELKKIADEKRVELPTQAPKDAHMHRLEGLSGAAFDRAYMSDMLSDHRHDVAAFKKEAASGHDPQVKAFATETLPTLEAHLQLAEQTHETLSGKTASGTSGMKK